MRSVDLKDCQEGGDAVLKPSFPSGPTRTSCPVCDGCCWNVAVYRNCGMASELNLVIGRADIYRTVVFVAFLHAHRVSMAA